MSDLKQIDKHRLSELLPNLDAVIDPQDLADYQADFKAMAKVFKQMATYAEAEQMAMVLRLRSNIATAQALEKRCDTIHAELPDWAKW